MLEDIEKCVDELKHLSLSINRGLQVQGDMLNRAEHKMDGNINKLATANTRLQRVLEENGGVTRWCSLLVCLVVLLALVGYILQIV